jgi:hypothetical protein
MLTPAASRSPVARWAGLWPVYRAAPLAAWFTLRVVAVNPITGEVNAGALAEGASG